MALARACARGATRLCSRPQGQQYALPVGYRALSMAPGSASRMAKFVDPIVRDDEDTASAVKLRVPTREDARQMPRAMCELDNETLVVLAESGANEACFERLIREIMCVDDVDWAVAHRTAMEIRRENRKVLFLATLPYQVGIATGLVTGIGCIPLVFHAGLAKWFNTTFVTMEVPDASEIVTSLEVGAWTWSWMEPVLGTASFTLLGLQFVRAQMLNMDLHPYTTAVRKYRANRLTKLYPKYNADIVADFAMTASMKPRFG